MGSNRVKMSIADRAKQFMPFAALKGLEEVLSEKEKVVVEKVELTEDSIEQLNWKVSQLKVRDIATVVYFSKGEYLKVTGMVSRMDPLSRILQIVNTKINLDDIYDMEVQQRDEE